MERTSEMPSAVLLTFTQISFHPVSILQDGYSHFAAKETEPREIHTKQQSVAQSELPPVLHGSNTCPFYTSPSNRQGQDFTLSGRKHALPLGACELQFRVSQLLLLSPLPRQVRGKLFLEKPRPKAGEEVVPPPSVGRTTLTSTAHQTHTGVTGGTRSLVTALSL